jgi:alpha-L-arabinofuranosidase
MKHKMAAGSREEQSDLYFPCTISEPPGDKIPNFVVSCVKDIHAGRIILKLVNGSSRAISAQVNLSQLGPIKPEATRMVLSGEPSAFNSFKNPKVIVPATTNFIVGESFEYNAPLNSLTVVRMKMR